MGSYVPVKEMRTVNQLSNEKCQSFLKPFETIGDKTLLGRGEEFVSTHLYP